MATEKKAPAKKAAKKKVVAKKPTAKKPVVKKAPAKKAAVKETPVKKVAVTKVAAKKAPVKKAVARKPVAKKAPANKVAVKKAPVKKALVKKAPVKKTTVKKSPAKKVAVKKAPARKAPVKQASVNEALLNRAPSTELVAKTVDSETKLSSVAVLEPVSNPAVSVREELPVSAPLEQVKPGEAEKKRRLGFFLLVAAVALFGFALISNAGSTSEEKEVVKEEVVEEPSVSPAPVVLEAPVDVFADYTPTGGIVTWSAPSTSDQLTGYLVQASYRGGAFETLKSVDPSVLSFEVMKIDTPGFTSFRVVAIYGESEVPSEVSDLKGQYQSE